jgi:UrcA family protein
MTDANTKFTEFLHGSLLAALTACMAVGLTSVARSATPDAAPSVRVPYGDLDLTSEQGVNTLHARVTAAARQVCGSDVVGIRNLQAYAAARSCEAQAIESAVRGVPGVKVAASLAARHEQT